MLSALIYRKTAKKTLWRKKYGLDGMRGMFIGKESSSC